MAKRDKNFYASKEDQQVEAKLEELEKEFYRHEQRARKAASEYEELMSRTASILSSMAALRKFRNERRRNSSGHF
jgi:hypothetical protein